MFKHRRKTGKHHKYTVAGVKFRFWMYFFFICLQIFVTQYVKYYYWSGADPGGGGTRRPP